MELNHLPERVELIEVGLRDGLQREAVLLPTADKASVVRALVDAGLRRVQVTAFVHPRRVPQMADAEELCALLPEHDGVHYSGLALNLKGVERAVAAGLRYVDMGISVNDEHSQRNANRTVDEALADLERMVAAARGHGMRVRAALQCAFGYRTPDDVLPARVLVLAERLLALTIDEIALADSAGLADPRRVAQLAGAVVKQAAGRPVILHLHNTRGLGLANLLAALQVGVRHFDTAFGGLGGCPFIDGAAGNIATEDTVYLLDRLNIATDVDAPQVAAVARRVGQLLGRPLPGALANLPPDLLPARVQER